MLRDRIRASPGGQSTDTREIFGEWRSWLRADGLSNFLAELEGGWAGWLAGELWWLQLIPLRTVFWKPWRLVYSVRKGTQIA